MRIGVIIGSLGFGGAERVAVILAEWWTEKGHSVEFFTTMRRPEKEYPFSPKIKRTECKGNKKISTIKLLRAKIKESKPDVVLVMDTPMCVFAVPALVGLKIPFVVSERSAPNTTAIKKSTKILSHILMNFATGFVFQTNGAKSYYHKRIQLRSTIIANPLQVDKLPRVFKGERDKRAVAVGRLVLAKNYPFMFMVFSAFHEKHSDYTLEVYGDGPLYDELSELIRKLDAGSYIKLMGSSDVVLERIKSAGFYILSSEIEGMPNALIEAMALGIPCISTDCPSGGPKDLIRDGVDGFLVPVSDRSQMLDAMEKIVSNDETADMLGRNATYIRNRLDINIIGQKWIDCFNDLLA